MTIALAITNLIAIFFIAFIWAKSDWMNAIIKMFFVGLAIANIVYVLQLFGLVVKV